MQITKKLAKDPGERAPQRQRSMLDPPFCRPAAEACAGDKDGEDGKADGDNGKSGTFIPVRLVPVERSRIDLMLGVGEGCDVFVSAFSVVVPTWATLMSRPWTVTKHGMINKHEDNLWSVAGDVPGMPRATRRMAIVRLDDGRLLFFNALPLDEETLAEVTAWGKAWGLVLPNASHCIDGPAFRERLKLTAFGPTKDTKLVEKIAIEDFSTMPTDRSFSIEAVAGTKAGEPVLSVRSGGGRATLVFADALMNNRNGPGLRGFYYKLIGLTGNTPRVAAAWKTLFVDDKDALRAQYEKWIGTKGLIRLMPTHGHIIEDDCRGALAAAQATI